MGQITHGDKIYSRVCNVCDLFWSDFPGGFSSNEHTVFVGVILTHLYRFSRVELSIVSSSTKVAPADNASSKLSQRIHFNLNRYQVPRHRLSLRDGFRNVASNGNMIVFNQNCIIQPHAMIGAAATTNRIFL